MAIHNNSPLVLVADDQVPTTTMLERIFSHEGYAVKCVYDGEAALESAQTLRPDLILLDINMPRMNGLEVLRHLRENAATENIPTILITAMGEPTDIAQGLNLGADDYLPKPFHPHELLARAQSKIKARELKEILHRRTQDLEVLLRVSEELSQHLAVDELLDFVLFLTLDLLPSDIAAIFQLAESGTIVNYRVKKKDGLPTKEASVSEQIVQQLRTREQAILWPPGTPMIADYANGMATPLRHGDQTIGLLLLATSNPLDENHLRLFDGVGRQTALALRNAELYEIQANYAQHLEDMVAERTQELESAQQLLIRSEKLASVGRLAASIAHEINNPLFPIRINLEHMLEDVQSSSSILPEDIEETLRSVERISRIVNQLLAFSGKRSEEISKIEPIDISDIIENVISLNRKFFEQENVTIDAHLAPLPPLMSSRDQLEQVFMNLALNAQAAMEGGGTLTIRTRVEDNYVVVDFEDSGCGIPQESLERIFEPFVSTKESGTGLGLFISYGIIQNHNGMISVESTVDVGTTFEVRLPITNLDAYLERSGNKEIP
jgi:signal transduction histidine kinase